VFYAGFAEAGFFHPGYAIGASVVEAAVGFDEHIEAHEESEGVLRAIVVDDGVVSDECSAFGECFIGFADEQFFLFQVPVVEDVSHHDDVDLGQRIGEEAACAETEA
jgi:hypothetical protein